MSDIGHNESKLVTMLIFASWTLLLFLIWTADSCHRYDADRRLEQIKIQTGVTQ